MAWRRSEEPPGWKRQSWAFGRLEEAQQRGGELGKTLQLGEERKLEQQEPEHRRLQPVAEVRMQQP